MAFLQEGVSEQRCLHVLQPLIILVNQVVTNPKLFTRQVEFQCLTARYQQQDFRSFFMSGVSRGLSHKVETVAAVGV